MNIKLITFLIVTLLWAQVSVAQQAGKVKAVQFPSWIERGDEIIAIRPGIMVEQGDVIKTGEHGKLLLSMNDGSDIKLGNRSHIDIKIVDNAQKRNDNVFGLALNVLKGVFRFTTTVVGKNRKRDIGITFGSVTAGIRGTDIWGRVDQQADLVCLLEGKIDVSHPQSDTIILDEPRQYYDAAPGEAGALKGKVDEAQVRQWAALTDVDSTQGVMHENGQWAVVVMSLKNIQHAEAFVEQLNIQGYPSEIQTSRVNNETYYRVVVPFFLTRQDAKNAQQRLNKVVGINQAWVNKYSF